MKLSSEIRLPQLRMEAAFEPSTLSEEDRTVEIRWYAGATVPRFSLFDGPYKLTFAMDEKSVRLDRLASGTAPLKGGHGSNDDPKATIGVIEKAWMAEDGGRAIVRFSRRPDVEPLFQDVKDGILRNVSMEARIHALRDVTKKGESEPHFLATDWEPLAVALVSVGADAAAQALSDSAPTFPCIVHNLSAEASANAHKRASAPKEKKAMKIKVRLIEDIEDVGRLGDIVEIDEAAFDEQLHSKDLEELAFDAKTARRKADDYIEADKARAKEIKRIQAHFNLDDVWSQRHIKQNSSIEQVLNDATEQRTKLDPVINGRVSLGEDRETIPYRMQRMADALSSRASRTAPPDSARDYATFSIAECAFELLHMRGMTAGLALDARRAPAEVVRLALNTTSDFPKLLENVLNKQLLGAYNTASPTFTQIAARKEFSDFRAHSFLRAGDFPNLLQVGENGEFKYGTMGESKETVTAVTYGRILGISRQVLINDNVGAFNDFGTMVSRRVADFENATFFSTCITAAAGLGPTLANDSVAVYNAAHSNLLSAGALSNDRLGEAFGLMMAQTSIDGLKLNTMPRIILVSPTSYTLARTLIANITPAQASQVNPFAGDMVAIADANLSGTRYYVLADPGVLPNYVYGTLEGQAGPYTEVRTGFEVDGIEVKVRDDFACGAIEYRGGCTGAGS